MGAAVPPPPLRTTTATLRDRDRGTWLRGRGGRSWPPGPPTAEHRRDLPPLRTRRARSFRRCQPGGRFSRRGWAQVVRGETMMIRPLVPLTLRPTAATSCNRGRGCRGAPGRGGAVCRGGGEHRRDLAPRLRGAQSRPVRPLREPSARGAFLPVREGAGGPRRRARS